MHSNLHSIDEASSKTRFNLAPGWTSPALQGDEKRTFTISLVLYALVLFPLLIADRYNVDDWGRSVRGYLNWRKDGRPLTDLVIRVLDLGNPLLDFSPICQIGTIVCLSWLSALIARKFEIRRPFIAALTALPLGANPFFLANLSFKFDSLPMALSISLALIPIVLENAPDRNKRRSLLIGALLLLGSLCLYQPSLNAFLVFAVFEYLLLQRRNESSAALTALVMRRVLQLAIAVLMYKIVALHTVHGGYGNDHSSLVSAFAIVQRNLAAFWSFPVQMLTGTLRFTLLLPLLLALLASIAVALRYSGWIGNSGKVVWISSAFLTPMFVLFGVFGFMIFLQSPTGGARTFIGFGALLASSLILISSILTEYNVSGRLQCALLFIPAYTMIAFAAIYANATKVQKDYERHIAEKLSDDLKEVMATKSVSALIIEGSVGSAPLLKRMVEDRYVLLGHLVSVDLRSDENGGFAHTVLRYLGINLPAETSKARRSSIVAEIVNATPLRVNSYYEIFVLDDDLVVRLIPGTGRI
jgi:Glucosyl transferase GtrII